MMRKDRPKNLSLLNESKAIGRKKKRGRFGKNSKLIFKK